MKKQLIYLVLLSIAGLGILNAGVGTISLINETGHDIYVRAKFYQEDGAQVRFGSYHFLKVGKTAESIPGMPHKKEDSLFIQSGAIKAGQTVKVVIDAQKDLCRWLRLNVPGYGQPKVLAEKDGKTVCIKGERLDHPTANFNDSDFFLKKFKVKVPAMSTYCDTQKCDRTFNQKCKNNHNCGLLKFKDPKIKVNGSNLVVVVRQDPKTQAISVELA